MSKQQWIFMIGLKKMAKPIFAFAMWVALTSSNAQGQIEVPNQAPGPPLAKDQLHPSAEARISNSLQAPRESVNNSSGAANAHTGDQILDDVLDVIRKQGSVLRGSELDPDSELPAIPLNEGFQTRDHSTPSGPSESAHKNASYLVAEQLLRSARALESLGGLTDRRAELIHGMRSQAAKLLVDAISNDLRPIQP